MIKFVKHKQPEQQQVSTQQELSTASSLTSSSYKSAKNFFKKKGESNDSGTESDGDILDVDIKHHHHLELDMETSFSSCTNANSPTDTICSSESSAMMCKSHLQYDQHSSEEELEVINGPSSVAAAEAAASNVLTTARGTSSLISERGTSSLDPDELQGEAAALKRSSSTLVENRKRSLAHSSDDDLRNFLEPILTPVNFRTSPPLEAFKPNRSHMYRSTTPLILQEARCGIENIKLCDNSVNDENGGGGVLGNNGDSSSCAMGTEEENAENNADAMGGVGGGGGNHSSITSSSIIKMKMSGSTSSHHIYQPQAKHNFHFNSSRSSPASTTGLDVEVRSVSPPAKLFHCAISPRRRPMRTPHNSQRLQRPHRPCLDFDKMQQVSL
ncbi:regulator of eph expression isoform X1 [Haematobia irritans]|uniref:regulator of eph expression isoform X1 n=2 Tax=Haematobia irritans TaxID=7368 RepID=UPI003F500B03